MTDDTFRRKLEHLRCRIDQLPPELHDRLYAQLGEAQRRHAEISKNLKNTRTALDDWRLAMKCAVFSYETRPGRRGSGGLAEDDSRE